MALLQNGFRDRSSGTRYAGAGVSNNAYPAALVGNTAATSLNRNQHDGTGITTPLAAMPSGARNRESWLMARTGGALAARNTIRGSGSHAGAIAGGKNADASLAGAGTLSGTGALIISLVATITGSGMITDAAARGFLNLAAALAGAGDVAGAVRAIGSAAAIVRGAGDASATIRATGALASSIVVTGSVLTTEGVASAVWAKVLEAGFTAEDILRLIAAATVGESDGAPNGPIAFTGLDGATVRVEGDVDTDGNRSNITYDAS